MNAQALHSAWPVFLLFLLPVAIVAVLLARVGTQLRRVVLLGAPAASVGAVLAVVLMGVV